MLLAYPPFLWKGRKGKKGKGRKKKMEERNDNENKKGKVRNGKKGLNKKWHTNIIPKKIPPISPLTITPIPN
jgi:hypothetical protein